MQQIIKTRSGRKLVLPNDEEDAMINQGILFDSDTFEPTEEQLRQFRPLNRGRPCLEQVKEKITIRLSPDTLALFRRTGSGWQTRIDVALREWLLDHPDIR